MSIAKPYMPYWPHEPHKPNGPYKSHKPHEPFLSPCSWGSLRIIGVLCGLWLCLGVGAAEPQDSIAPADTAVVRKPRKLSLIRRIIRGFDRLNKDYIEPQHFTYTVMLQATHTYDRYSLSGAGSDAQSLTFAPDMTMRVGPYVGWKWFFAGYTFKLSNVSLSDLKQELDLSVYSSQIGVDLFFRRTGTNYKIRNAHLTKRQWDTALDGASFSGLKAGIKGLNIYYIFNHGRFSYPAAFAQSTIQKVSCGSPLAGVGYTRHSLSLDYQSLQQLVDERMGPHTVPLDSGLMFRSVKYDDFSLSGGYAYNWVFRKNWLFAASGQVAVAYKHTVGDVIESHSNDFSFDNFNLDMIGRFGVVYNCMRWYAGVNVILHSYNYHKSRFSTNNTFGSMNAYIGYNFGLKKKYREHHETTY